jgi:4-oxalocrotonate tautomerase
MPLVQINMITGRTKEKKEELIYEITKTVSEIADAPIDSIHVIFNEVEPEDWGLEGASLKKRREQQ